MILDFSFASSVGILCVLQILPLLTSGTGCRFGLFTPKEERCLVMEEDNPHGVVGQVLELKCYLQEPFFKRYPHCNSHMIYFIPNHDGHVEYVSEKQAIFRQNITEPVHTVYSCRVNQTLCENMTKAITATQSVKFGLPPIAPQFNPCVVYNWESMNCTWGPRQTENELWLKTRTNATWSTSSSTGHCGIEDHKLRFHENSCFFTGANLTLYEQYKIEVVIRNIKTAYNSTTVQPLLKVKIKKIKNVTVEKVFPKSAEMKWEPPSTISSEPKVKEHVHNGTYIYRLFYKRWQDTLWKNETFEKPVVHSVFYLKGLHSATKYEIKLDVKTKHGGYFSDYSDVTNFETLEDVPGEDPVLFNGGFSWTETHVIMYWKGVSPEKKHGNIRYKLCIRDIDIADDVKFFNTTADENYMVLNKQDLQPGHKYEVSVTACTAVGCKRSLQNIHPGRVMHGLQIIKRPEMFKVAQHLAAELNQLDGTITVYWHNTQKDVQHVVFWCISAGNQKFCEKNLNSTGILHNSDGQLPFYTIKVPTSNISISRYLVGISSRYNNIYSGIKWLTRCYFYANKSVANPSDVEVKPNGHNTLLVTWRIEDCISPVSFSKKLIVFYCIAHEKKCVEKTHGKVVYWYENATTLTNLESDSEYKVWVIGQHGQANNIPTFSPVYAMVTKHWLLDGRILAALIVGTIIFGTITLIGIFVVCRKAYKFRKKMTDLEYINPAEIEGTSNFMYRQESYDSGRDSGRGSLTYDQPSPRFCPNCNKETGLEMIPEDNGENSGSTVGKLDYVLAPPTLEKPSQRSITNGTERQERPLNYVTIAPEENCDDVFEDPVDESSVNTPIHISNKPDLSVFYDRSRGGSTSPLLREETPYIVTPPGFDFNPKPPLQNWNYVTEKDVQANSSKITGQLQNLPPERMPEIHLDVQDKSSKIPGRVQNLAPERMPEIQLKSTSAYVTEDELKLNDNMRKEDKTYQDHKPTCATPPEIKSLDVSESDNVVFNQESFEDTNDFKDNNNDIKLDHDEDSITKLKSGNIQNNKKTSLGYVDISNGEIIPHVHNFDQETKEKSQPSDQNENTYLSGKSSDKQFHMENQNKSNEIRPDTEVPFDIDSQAQNITSGNHGNNFESPSMLCRSDTPYVSEGLVDTMYNCSKELPADIDDETNEESVSMIKATPNSGSDELPYVSHADLERHFPPRGSHINQNELAKCIV